MFPFSRISKFTATVAAATLVLAQVAQPASAIGDRKITLICDETPNGLQVVWSIQMLEAHENIAAVDGVLRFGSGDDIPLSNSGTSLEPGHTIRLFPPSSTLRGEALSSILPTHPDDMFVSLSATVTTISHQVVTSVDPVGPVWADCE